MDFINGLINNIKEKQPINECDYKIDGILYCGICNTPKDTIITYCGRKITVPTLCECSKKKRDTINKQDIQRRKQQRIELKREYCFSDSTQLKQRTYTFDTARETEHLKELKKYADKFAQIVETGKGFILLGNSGAGKTYSCCCICNELINNGYSCKMISADKITKEIQQDFNNQLNYIDRLCSVDLLVIDDYGSESKTEFAQSNIFSVINARYDSGKPLIITTNMTASQFANPATEQEMKIISRLNEMCLPLVYVGKDQRTINSAIKTNELLNILKEG